MPDSSDNGCYGCGCFLVCAAVAFAIVLYALKHWG